VKQKEYHRLREKSVQNQEECRRFKNIHLFEKPFATKSLAYLTRNEGLMKKVINEKYIALGSMI